jgi:hypothetical protein
MSDEEIAQLQEQNIIAGTPVSAVPLPVMRMFVQFPTTSFSQMGALAGLDTDYREQLGIEAPGET